MERSVQLDFFRGLFLLIIATNHFLSRENIIHHFTYEYIGWITAAEGFVFLSGLTAGMVYARKLVEKGEAFISRAARKRAWTIYKYHIIFFLLVTVILLTHPVMKAYWYREMQVFEMLFQKPFLSILLGFGLLYQPIYLDILPMYAIFLLLLPLCLKLFRQGKAWLVLGVSFVVYLAGTFEAGSLLFQQVRLLEPVDMGFFNLLSWQFLFVSGMYVGYLTFQERVSWVLQNNKLFYVAVLLCVVLFLFKKVFYRFDTLLLYMDYWISKENLGPLKLLNFFALTVAVSFVAARYKKWFSLKPVCYLGRYSLEVFALHILLIVIFKPIKDYFDSFYAIQVGNELYFYPWSTLMLLLIVLPALFLAPLLKNSLKGAELKVKPSSNQKS